MPYGAPKTVMQRPNDPNIYLWVMGEWYCYNPYEKPIGSGAMGDVYKGIRCSNRAPVAIKRVKDFYANNQQIRERARQEASLAFRHQNLVEMIGYCEYAPTTGPIFLLSHFVEGEDADKFVRHFDGSPQRTEKICNIICCVLDALDYVHSKGVIHRDIKPSNIMIEQNSNVRLMDLGIARMNGGNKFSSLGFIGTPEYSAPEQIRREENGSSAQINATTDIYELGITFYELLTGHNPMADVAEAKTLSKQINDPLPASPLIPRRLMRVLWKATEKMQAKRYQTALEFKNAIREALQPEPSGFGHWVGTHIGLFIGIIAGIVSVIVLIIILLTLNN